MIIQVFNVGVIYCLSEPNFFYHIVNTEIIGQKSDLSLKIMSRLLNEHTEFLQLQRIVIFLVFIEFFFWFLIWIHKIVFRKNFNIIKIFIEESIEVLSFRSAEYPFSKKIQILVCDHVEVIKWEPVFNVKGIHSNY